MIIIIILVVILIGVIYTYTYFSILKQKKETTQTIEKFIKNATKVSIDLTSITVTGRSFQTEVIAEQHSLEEHFLEDKSTYQKEFESKFTISTEVSGITYSYKIQLPYEDTWLKTHFYIKQSTDLYIANNDNSHTCIDFRFLDQPNLDYVFVR